MTFPAPTILPTSAGAGAALGASNPFALAGVAGAQVLSGLVNQPAGPAISGIEKIGTSEGRNIFNIAPVGVNLGEILNNLTGPPENGGMGLDVPSRLLFGDNSNGSILAGGVNPLMLIVGLAVIGVAIVVINPK